MNVERYRCRKPDDTIHIGKEIGTRLKAGDIVLLKGSLGAGKTTFVKGIAASIGIEDEVTSPTFTIISVYSGNVDLYHIDLYRIEGDDDLEELGLYDYLYGEGISVIEWGERIEDRIQGLPLSIVIDIKENGEREITVTGFDD
ncbi:MAG: tRNA (adenosine(37)-N6)-threonylcarbamoyltransferase complex ATPase subunit type 1 TsaE [Spirochaetales bacterium]|nr:tRNA (adenosine(37)-N6)-threonylcarbamoyltransferase complex ATPase subunit type 1 TsaE [Spirochaetales bacterium]